MMEKVNQVEMNITERYINWYSTQKKKRASIILNLQRGKVYIYKMRDHSRDPLSWEMRKKKTIQIRTGRIVSLHLIRATLFRIGIADVSSAFSFF